MQPPRVERDPLPTTIGGPALPSLSSLLAPDAPPAAGAPDTTPSTAGRETPDDLALRLPDGEGKPADDGTGLLIALAVVLIAVVAAGAGYAWHHRPSRYFAA